MAILKNGLLGGITGKLGNTVYYMLHGQQVVRMIGKSSKPPTQRQLDNWAEMGVVNDFLRPIKVYVELGFALEAKRRKAHAYNIALGYIKKHALKGEAAEREIDYSKVMLSLGDLPGLRDVEARLDESLLTVSWSPVYNEPGRSSDQVMVMAYYPPTAQKDDTFACFNLCGADRSQGQDVLQLPLHFSSRPIEVYVFARAANGKSVSNSQYLGRLAPA